MTQKPRELKVLKAFMDLPIINGNEDSYFVTACRIPLLDSGTHYTFREVLPDENKIDWDRVFSNIALHVEEQKIIKQLVEKSLRGEL